MKRLGLIGVVAALLSAPVGAATCEDEAGDAALVAAGHAPGASAVHEIKGVGRFDVPMHFRLSRRAVRGQAPATDQTGKGPAWTYTLKKVPDSPTALFSIQFLLPRDGTDCRDPFVVDAMIAAGDLANGPPFDARLLLKIASGQNPRVTPVDVGDGLLRLDGATNMLEPVLMFAYLGNGSALRIVDGTDDLPRSTFNGLYAERGWALNVYYQHPDWELWRTVLNEIEALLDAWRIGG